jgi:hypothetical protein
MAINSRSINSKAINSSDFDQQAAFTVGRSIEQSVFEIHVVSRSVEQAVFEIHIVSRDIEQTVAFLEVFTVSRGIQQAVFELFTAGRNVEQRVSTPFPAQDAIAWEAIVKVDGVFQPKLTGVVSVSGGEGEQILATFQIKPESGVVAVEDWIAKSVTIDYADQFVYKRLFTGIVDEVDYDATASLLSFICITNRKDLINAKTRGQLDTEIGGFWSKFIFDEDAENFEYASDLISTVFAAYETTPFNQFLLVPFAAKATADITYAEDDIIDGSAVPTFVSRDQLVNTWTLNFGYRFNRLRQRERDYQWDLLAKIGTSDGFGNWAEFLQDPVTFLPRDGVQTAIEQSRWVLKGAIAFTDLPPAGFYDGVGWTPKQSTIKLDENGNVIARSTKDVSKVYTTSADFTLALRFAQQLTEEYEIKMTAPQSVSQYGEIKENTQRGISANYDIDAWEDFTKYEAPAGSLSDNGDFVLDQDTDKIKDGTRADFDNAAVTAQAIIKRTILDSHRQNYTEFNVLLDPDVDLTKTIYVNTARIQARGKVYQFEHILDIDQSEPSAITVVKLAISKATGSQSDDGINVPTKPTVTDATFVPIPIRLQSHFGNHFDSPAYDEIWSGYITNFRFQDFISASLNTYPVKFTVDGEKIGDEDRKERKLPAPSTVNIEIPNELLTITAP